MRCKSNHSENAPIPRHLASHIPKYPKPAYPTVAVTLALALVVALAVVVAVVIAVALAVLSVIPEGNLLLALAVALAVMQ